MLQIDIEETKDEAVVETAPEENTEQETQKNQ